MVFEWVALLLLILEVAYLKLAQGMPILTVFKWVPCHHGMAHSQVEDVGDGLQIWRVAANILNKQSRTAERA
jgi:hypothetical protein